MRKLIIIMLSVCFSFIVCTEVKAADWTNGTFSCNLEVTKLAPWYDLFNLGKWESFNVHFYKDFAPADALTYQCYLSTNNHTDFTCTILPSQLQTADKLYKRDFFTLTIPAKTSKNGACEIAYHSATK